MNPSFAARRIEPTLAVWVVSTTGSPGRTASNQSSAAAHASAAYPTRAAHAPASRKATSTPQGQAATDWEQAADIAVAILRTEAGRNPHDKDLHDLIGELSTRSDDFRTRWGAHNVRHHGTGTKRFHHRAVGDRTLAYEGLEMAAEPGLTLTSYTAEPASLSEEGLRLLPTWAATQDVGAPAARAAD